MEKIALVTGSSRGIGRAAVRKLAAAGYAVCINYRERQDCADALVEELTAAGQRAMAVQADVSVRQQVNDMVRRVEDAFGPVSLLVNNAGGGGPKPFDMPMDDFRWAYEINVFGLFRLIQLATPHMEKEKRGAVLNISSMSGENKNTRMASYGSSKAAVNHLTRNIAFDLGAKGIRVNAIAPGATKTDALASVLTPEIEATMLQHTPIKRLGEAEDIARAALFLCSPAASWISGQLLTVSGGGVQELD